MFSFLRRSRRPPAPSWKPPDLTPTPAIPPDVLTQQREASDNWHYRPLISILTPVYRVAPALLAAAIESVRAQSYQRWELCLTVDRAEDASVLDLVRQAASEDPRIRMQELDDNLGIAGNSNACLAMAQGEYIALLDHDDALAPHALYEMVRVLQQRPHVDVLYSDKDSFGVHPVVKPGWSPELLWSSSYLTHLTVLRTSLVREAGGFRSAVDGAQDWDLYCRAITRSVVVQHVPGMLYHWRIHAGSTSTGLSTKPYVAAAQSQVVDEHLARLGLDARTVRDDRGELRLRWEQPERQSVSVLLIGGDEQRAASLRLRTRYAAFEVLAVPDYRQINYAVRQSTGQCVLLLDQSVRPRHEAWLQELIPPLQFGSIGAVAPLLLNPYTHQIRHAGFAFTRSGELLTPFAGEPVGRFGPLGRNDWYRNWSALSGACLAMRREAYDAVQGLPGTRPWHTRPDVDLCLRLQYVAGLRLLLQASAAVEQTGPTWCDVDADSAPGLFPEGDPYYPAALDQTTAPPFVLPPQAGAPPEIALIPGPARSVTWVLSDLRDLQRYEAVFAHAERLRTEAHLRSHFVIVEDRAAPLYRHRLAAVYPRLAADCAFTAADAPSVIVATSADVLHLAASLPGAISRYAFGVREPEVLERFAGRFSWIDSLAEVRV